VLKASWQRCRVHFLRSALAYAKKGQRQMVFALINTIFAQETTEASHAQWRVVADQLRSKFPKLAAMMNEAYMRYATRVLAVRVGGYQGRVSTVRMTLSEWPLFKFIQVSGTARPNVRDESHCW
jgi:glutathionylspermidine synthase